MSTDQSSADAKIHVTKRKELTPALVQRVAEEVYRLFMRDMKLGRERMGLSQRHAQPLHKTQRKW